MIKILLVDDEREEREGIAYLIHKYNYPLAVMEAANGKEALRRIRSQEIDILFTDIKMPAMSGLELAREAKELNPSIKIIIFSAYADFEYAKQAIEMSAVSYLIKPIEIEEFRHLMSDVIASIEEGRQNKLKMEEAERAGRKNLLYKVFAGMRMEPGEREELKSILFSGGDVRFFLLNVEFMGNYLEEQEDFFKKLIKRYLGEDVEYIGLYSNEAYLIIPGIELLRRNTLKEQIGKLSRELFRDIKDEASYLASAPIESMEEFEAQLQAVHSVRSDIFGYDNQVVRTNDYYHDAGHYALDVETVRKQLFSAIEVMDAELIRRQSGQLVKVIASLKNISRIYIQNVLYSVIKAIYDRSPRMEMENILAGAESLFEAKDSKTMLSEYERLLEKILLSMASKAVDEPKITQRIKNIVETEYMKDIGLNEIAARVNLAPAYVSYIFKKETGQNLVKYITDVKMKKARRLLLDQGLKISQIGKMVGYENQSYFNRLFKNYYGMTPGQYREKE